MGRNNLFSKIVRRQPSLKMQTVFWGVRFLYFGVAILPHAQYGPYYVTAFFGTVMAGSWAGLFSLV